MEPYLIALLILSYCVGVVFVFVQFVEIIDYAQTSGEKCRAIWMMLVGFVFAPLVVYAVFGYGVGWMLINLFRK